MVPPLWRWEVANALFQAERRNRITPAETEGHLVALCKLPIEMDENAAQEAWNAALSLSRKHRLTVYDSAYLELALRKGLPLGTLDQALREAAAAEGLTLAPKNL